MRAVYADQLDGSEKMAASLCPIDRLGVAYDSAFIKRHRTQLHEFK